MARMFHKSAWRSGGLTAVAAIMVAVSLPVAADAAADDQGWGHRGEQGGGQRGGGQSGGQSGGGQHDGGQRGGWQGGGMPQGRWNGAPQGNAAPAARPQVQAPSQPAPSRNWRGGDAPQMQTRVVPGMHGSVPSGWTGRGPDAPAPRNDATNHGPRIIEPAREAGGNWRGGDQRGGDRRDGEWRGGDRRDGGWRDGGRPAPGGSYRAWTHDWRQDNRYDWRNWRDAHRDTFHIGRYYAPYRGYYYRRLSIGIVLEPLFFGSDYWIYDPWDYHLPPAYGPYHWVRYYDDALLVNTYTGQVVDVIYDFFW